MAIFSIQKHTKEAALIMRTLCWWISTALRLHAPLMMTVRGKTNAVRMSAEPGIVKKVRMNIYVLGMSVEPGIVMKVKRKIYVVRSGTWHYGEGKKENICCKN